MGTIITFPKPKLSGSISLEQTIAERRSKRDFSSQVLSLEQIGQLLWAAQGTGPDGRHRNSPSAGATYPLELFVVTGDGLFRYLPAEHAMEKESDSDLRASLALAALSQGFVEAAPLTIVITAEFKRTTSHYGRRGIRYVYNEAGHVAQNVHLQAQAMGLGSVAVGAFKDKAVAKAISLPRHLEPVYMVTVGYCQ
jgi:SagB-type dehydrogenase family enzyme